MWPLDFWENLPKTCAESQIEPYIFIWSCVRLFANSNFFPLQCAHPFAMWYCFSTHQEGTFIYLSFGLGLATWLAYGMLANMIQGHWKMIEKCLQMDFAFSFWTRNHETPPWTQSSLIKRSCIENQDTLVNSLPTPNMWLNPSWATQPQPSPRRPGFSQPSQPTIESWAA